MKKQQIKEDKLDILRHSTAHILAAAVLEMFPKAKFGIGPTIENGFYYDFDNIKISETDLPEIEKRMRNLIKKDLKFKKEIVSFAEAKKLFKDQPYKLDLIKELQKNKKKISVYKTSDSKRVIFLDLCSGPHIISTSKINPDTFKLLKIAGAYWRGDEKNKMLTRIYGTAFNNKKELEYYFYKLEETKKRDHRKLGKDLDLFSSHDDVGPGIFLWHPKASIIRIIIEDFWRAEHRKRNYQYVFTPHIGKLALWKTSGHWNFYRENMYTPMVTPEGEYMVKPMSCPFHILIYKNKPRSYKDLPIRYNELGTVYRLERAGTLHGLLRVRGFTQDDAHIFCRPDQLLDEITGVLDLALYMLSSFGFKEYQIELSTRDPKEKKKYMGDDKIWRKAEKALAKALEIKKLKYKIMPGEAKFYGPAIDIKLVDALDRGWQGPTIQLDFNLAKNFDVDYIDQKGKKQEAIILHRTVLGCMERFLGCLLEHFAGALPLWLSPIQVEIINVGSSHRQYANLINQQLITNNIRTNLSDENLTVSKRIREAEIQKIPYILVVGDKEVKNKTVNVRHYRRGQEGEIKIEKLIEKLQNEIKNKVI